MEIYAEKKDCGFEHVKYGLRLHCGNKQLQMSSFTDETSLIDFSEGLETAADGHHVTCLYIWLQPTSCKNDECC